MSVNEVFSHVEKDYLLPDMAPSEADEYTAKMNMIIAECFRRDPAARPSMTMLRVSARKSAMYTSPCI